MKVSIVIPMYNGYALTHQLLYDLLQVVSVDEILVMDDFSTEEKVTSGLNWWKTIQPKLRVIRNEENLGFLRTCNRGVGEALGDVVILISNDVRVYDKDIAQRVISAVAENTLVGTKVYRNDTGWNKFGDRIFPYAEGWFLAFMKSDWEKYGGFDTRYIPNDFEDVDISTTFLSNGGNLVEIKSSCVHLGGQTIKYSPERSALTERNRKKFEEKWLK